MQISDLSGVAVTLVVAAIVIALGLNILSETSDEFTAKSYEANATEDAIEGVSKLSSKLPLIGLAVAAVIVISVIVGSFRTNTA
jgi:predicted RND superfamily exporter protein